MTFNCTRNDPDTVSSSGSASGTASVARGMPLLSCAFPSAVSSFVSALTLPVAGSALLLQHATVLVIWTFAVCVALLSRTSRFLPESPSAFFLLPVHALISGSHVIYWVAVFALQYIHTVMPDSAAPVMAASWLEAAAKLLTQPSWLFHGAGLIVWAADFFLAAASTLQLVPLLAWCAVGPTLFMVVFEDFMWEALVDFYEGLCGRQRLGEPYDEVVSVVLKAFFWSVHLCAGVSGLVAASAASRRDGADSDAATLAIIRTGVAMAYPFALGYFIIPMFVLGHDRHPLFWRYRVLEFAPPAFSEICAGAWMTLVLDGRGASQIAVRLLCCSVVVTYLWVMLGIVSHPHFQQQIIPRVWRDAQRSCGGAATFGLPSSIVPL